MSNQRRAFRLDMHKEVCIVSNDYRLSKGYILNISDVGMALEVDVDLFEGVCDIEFELDNKEFFKSCRIVRKRPLESGRTFYAVNFFQKEKEREELFEKILKVQAIRVQQGKSYEN